MSRYSFLLPALALGLAASAGCASARYVQTGKGEGVVAIPKNTNVWPTYYRDKAEALIKAQCPNGYEIVLEEEAVTSQVAHTHAHTDTHPTPVVLVGGGEETKRERKHRKEHAESFGALAVPLGPTHQTTRQTTTYRDVTEWRIYYRAK